MEDREDVRDLLLKYNKDYLDVLMSDEYKLGCSLKKIISYLKGGKLKKIVDEISYKYKKIKIRRFRKEHFEECKKYNNISSTKIAVYKVIFGDYDRIRDPLYVDPQCDYYIITDQKLPEKSIWKQMDLSMVKAEGHYTDSQKNRYCKMNCCALFPEYDYSIYVDGNMELCGPVSELIAYVNPKTGIALHYMYFRDCIYDEAIVCKYLGLANGAMIQKQIDRYKKEGFPEHFGIYECPVIVRKHTQICKDIMTLWWEEYLNSAGRDQISLPYIIWKSGLAFADVGFLGDDVRKNPYFRQEEHKTK